jgi:hypothetical protein
VAFTPPGSTTSSRVTQKTFPWYTVLDEMVRPRPVSFTGFGTTLAEAFTEMFLAGLDFAGEGEMILGFLAVEVFLVPMTVQYTRRPNPRTRGFAASALLLEHPNSLRMRD